MPPNTLADLFSEITQMMSVYSPLFLNYGHQIFRSFVLILIVMWAANVGLKGEAFPVDNLARFLGGIVLCYIALHYYSTPIPGLGYSFTGVLTDNATWIANQLNQSMATQITTRLDQMYWSLETPGISAVINAVELLRWLITALCLIGAQIAVFFVISFGFVAVAICIVLGPIFLPFAILPGFEWVFWGWFKAFWGYLLYPVVANACVLVFGGLLINYIDRIGAVGLSTEQLAPRFMGLIFMLCAFMFGILKMPSMASNIAAGRSGEGTLPW
jgi:hypothetical protein